MVKISIACLIYKSKIYADWIYESIHEFTPMLKNNEAEFFFIANDPADDLLKYLNKKGYQYFVNYNPRKTDEELFKMGYSAPEYIHRVYRGWNRAILASTGEIIVLLNSDNYVSPDWLENLLKYLSPSTIVCSKLVERAHPKHGVFHSAYHEEFGTHPNNFQKDAFLLFVENHKITGLERGGSYMPCMFFKSSAIRVGLYPEGNIAGRSFGDVVAYGDEIFYKKLAKIGLKHVTALDSICYHIKEGEMDEDHSVEYTATFKIENKHKILKLLPLMISTYDDNEYLTIGKVKWINLISVFSIHKIKIYLKTNFPYVYKITRKIWKLFKK